MVIKILNGHGHEYKEISVAIHARDTPISYKELFDKLTNRDTFFKHD